MRLPRFYPILDSAQWVERALAVGAQLIQLRIKDASEATLRAEIDRALAVARRYGALLVVNDHWEAAIDAGADWLHLGQEDLDRADLGAVRRSGICLGVSTHDRAELERALTIGPDYVALGPIYPTILKKMKWHRQGLERITEWKRLIGDVPLCAIGGMSVERAPDALAAGADLIAVVTDITLNSDPEARVRAWLEVSR